MKKPSHSCLWSNPHCVVMPVGSLRNALKITMDDVGVNAPNCKLLKHAWNAVANAIFQHPFQATEIQKCCLKEGGTATSSISLDADEKIEVLDKARTSKIHTLMLAN